MGIKDFMFLIKNSNQCIYNHINDYNTILIDGSFLRNHSMNIVYTIYLKKYINYFNINHIYQDICIRSAIVSYLKIIKLNLTNVNKIIIYHDKNSDHELFFKLENKVYDYVKKKYYDHSNFVINSKNQNDSTKFINSYNNIMYYYFDPYLEIKTVTKIHRKSNIKFIVNEIECDVYRFKDLLNDELQRYYNSNMTRLSELKNYKFIEYLADSPFLISHFSEDLGIIYLNLMKLFLRRNLPNHIDLNIYSARIEADYDIFNYVYNSYINTPEEKILIISSDTDYQCICGYNPNVQIYTLKEFIYPYNLINELLLSKITFKDNINKTNLIVKYLIRLSHILGNDYFEGIVGTMPQKKIEEINMLFNINNSFKLIETLHPRMKIRNAYNDVTNCLSKYKHVFSPEIIDIIVLSSLSDDASKYKYITGLAYLEYMILEENNLDQDFLYQDVTISISSIKSKLLDIISQNNIIEKAGIPQNVYEAKINPFLRKRFVNSDSLYDIIRDFISDYVDVNDTGDCVEAQKLYAIRLINRDTMLDGFEELLHEIIRILEQRNKYNQLNIIFT